MNKRIKQMIMILTISGIGMLFLVAGINAEETGEKACVPDMMKMKNEQAFQQHRMGIVQFNHKKHAADKPDGYGLGCGDCHHDENGKPLSDLKPGDAVQSCFECHDKKNRPRRDPSMSPEEWKKEQLNYYYGAIHENCMGCHKKQGGPVRCTECHPRPQR